MVSNRSCFLASIFLSLSFPHLPSSPAAVPWPWSFKSRTSSECQQEEFQQLQSFRIFIFILVIGLAQAHSYFSDLSYILIPYSGNWASLLPVSGYSSPSTLVFCLGDCSLWDLEPAMLLSLLVRTLAPALWKGLLPADRHSGCHLLTPVSFWTSRSSVWAHKAVRLMHIWPNAILPNPNTIPVLSYQNQWR